MKRIVIVNGPNLNLLESANQDLRHSLARRPGQDGAREGARARSDGKVFQATTRARSSTSCRRRRQARSGS